MVERRERGGERENERMGMGNGGMKREESMNELSMWEENLE